MESHPTTDAPPGLLSFVSPVYKCADTLIELCDRIAAVATDLGRPFEIVLVDDGCPMGSWSTISKLAETRPEVRGIKLSRNFGQHSAIQAGLEHARGDMVVVLDCDLQDEPEAVPLLLAKADEGFDVVRARRVQRQDSALRRWLSRAFYRTLSYLTDTHQDPAVANFGVYRRKVVDALLSWDEQQRFFPVIVQWIGFDHAVVDVPQGSPRDNVSSYDLRKLVNLGLDVSLAFSDRPLRLVVKLGMILAAFTFVVSLIIFVLAVSGYFVVPGWASVMMSIWFLSGVLITVMGGAGLYIGRTLAEAKRRPVYLVDEDTARDRS